jgi:putative SOS response-associated peptidase YedK
MCGRCSRAANWREVHDFLDLSFPQYDDPGPSYNIAPTQTVPVCAWADGRTLAPMQWGLRPAWASDRPAGFINARAETASSKPAFRSAFKSRRCLIPVTGFYEWQKVGRTKQPFNIRMADGSLFALAGLWEEPIDEGGLSSFTILTVEPNTLVRPIHDRMPAIVAPAGFEAWLSADAPEPSLLGAYPAEAMAADPVSTRVNSPANNTPDLLEPESGEQAENLFGP